MPSEQTATFDCQVEQIKPAAEWVEGAAVRFGLDSQASLRLTLIVEELFANTIHHGEAAPDEPVRLNVVEEGDRLRMDYCDGGRAFDPTAIEIPDAPDLESWPIGGLGVRLIRAFASEAIYHRTDGQNVTTIWMDRTQ